MRLWHKCLIRVLPRQQLVAQWRELCCIMSNISENGSPNHILVNKVTDYPVSHFCQYARLVCNEMENRGYKVSKITRKRFLDRVAMSADKFNNEDERWEMFEDWHNNRYFKQCYYNLQEKYDCGGISQEEWNKIEAMFQDWEVRTIEELEKSLNVEVKFVDKENA